MVHSQACVFSAHPVVSRVPLRPGLACSAVPVYSPLPLPHSHWSKHIVNAFSRQSARSLCLDSTAIPLYMSLKRKFQPAFFENNITMGAKQSNMSAAQKQQYHPAQKRAKPRSSSTASNTAATRHNNKPTQPVANPM